MIQIDQNRNQMYPSGCIPSDRSPAANRSPLAELLSMPPPPPQPFSALYSSARVGSSPSPNHSPSFNRNNSCQIIGNRDSRDEYSGPMQRSASARMDSLSRIPSLRDHREVWINDIVGNGISGVLYKWVNYGKGWRPRWFVLQDGVLSYYKIHGPDKILINKETEKGSKIIGEESLRRISRRQSNIRTDSRRKPFGEIHLKVSTIRESKSDDKRFSIYTGTKRLHLRAKTREDRVLWVATLQALKDMFPRMSNSELMMSQVKDYMVVSTDRLRQRMCEEGVSEPVIQDCENIMRNEFSALQNHLLLLKQKHLLLIDTMRQLETEKVDLENTVVDETQRQSKDQESSSGLHHDKYSEQSPSESDNDNERNDAMEEETDEDDDNAFFDTRDFLSSSSVRSNGSDVQTSSVGSEDEMGLEFYDDSFIRSVGTDYPLVRRRKKLPDPAEKETGVSLWSMIKDNIGKDLNKVCLPVYFNEPLSSLQKCFEDLEYSYLLDQAYEWGKRGDSLMRALYVAAFAVSGYSSTEGRSCKPFNPLLGETYEADYPDRGLRFISEKVSHHPTIVACHCEGRGWKFWGDSNLKSKFWGRSIQIDPVGVLTLEFNDGEIFQWSKVTTSIYNLILGKLYCDHYGTMRIQGNQEYSCKLKFKEQSIIDRNPHQVQGVVQDKSGKTVASVIGKWDESLHYFNGDCLRKLKGTDMSEAHLLWKRSKPPRITHRCNLTRFAVTLNELTPGLKQKLPPTDSRLRPDQRCLENGEYEKANSEKIRLEHRQRQARTMQERGWKPRWFAKQKGEETYRYVGGYWETREEEAQWESCADIFGQVPNGTEV